MRRATFLAIVLIFNAASLIVLAQSKDKPLVSSSTAPGIAFESSYSEPSSICFSKEPNNQGGQVCVPLAMLRAAFKDYVDGSPSPVHVLEARLIDMQTQTADLLQQKRACEGQLGPLQAQQHADQLKGQRDALTKAIELEAPKGKVWNPATGKYEPKPEEPKKGREGGGGK